ncbi:MAG: ATP-binding protein [Pseudomonadota bacterium]
MIPAGELIALSPQPVALFDAEGALAATNPPFESVFRQIAEFLRPGTPWGLFLNEVQRHGVLPVAACHGLRLVEERLNGAEPPPVEAELAGGGVARVRLAGTSDGGFAMTLDLLDDAEAGESEIEELMAKVLEACPSSLTMARIGDGQILYRSPAATDLLGKGRNSQEHFAKRTERADFVTMLLPDSRVDDMRVTGRRGDGTEFPAAISARVIDYRGEEVVVSTMDDLSEELAMQDELARQKDQVFQAEKLSALGELLAGVAHELNNPLSIVVGNTHILLEEPFDDATLARLGKVNDAAERCVKIVRTFLSMARDRQLAVEPVPVAQVVETAVEAYRAGEQTADLAIAMDVAEGLPMLNVDEVQIVQVLSNLLINADHAIGETGQAGRVEISAASGAEGRVMLRLADDGPGIPDEIAGRVFDPLFTTKTGGKGTGVGLALCHRIVVAHGGTVKLDPTHAGGACFVIELPTV